MIKECKICKRPFVSSIAQKTMCSAECRKISERQYVEKVNAEKRAATRERLGIKRCVICGIPYFPVNCTQVACSKECQKKRNNENQKSLRVEKQKRKKPGENQKEIVNIAVKAKAMGMSYGQYVARYGGQ